MTSRLETLSYSISHFARQMMNEEFSWQLSPSEAAGWSLVLPSVCLAAKFKIS